MIMRGTTPKTLGWRGCLTALGLGALMLPPAWAQAQPANKANNKLPEPVVVGTADGGAAGKGDASPDEMEKVKAELKAAEAELKQKQLEAAILAEKVQRLRAKVLTAKPDAGGITAHFDGGHFILRLVGPEDEKPDALKDLLKQIQTIRPGAAEFIVIDQKTGKIIMKMQSAGAVPEHSHPLILVPVGPGGETAGSAPAADADKRIDELEQKLKGILHEVEKLRRERKEKAPEKPDEASAALSRAEHLFEEGNYDQALAVFDEIAARHPKEEIGVKALGGSVRCLAASNRPKEMEKRRQEIKARLGVLPTEARSQWEKWLDVSGPDDQK